MRTLRIWLTVLTLSVMAAPRAAAYIDLTPTLARIIRQSQGIALVEVEKFSRETGAVVLKKVVDLRGPSTENRYRHQVSAGTGLGVPQYLVGWAEPGQRAVVFFSSNSSCLVCIGYHWYQAQAASDGWFRLILERPDLSLAYSGKAGRLAVSVLSMLSGRDAILTVLAHGAEDEGASIDVALNRTSLPGLLRLERLRANMNMSDRVIDVSANPGYFIGLGLADEKDIPVLMERLGSAEPTVRAEAADELRTLGPKANGALEPLRRLLDDRAPMVSLSAAATLANIAPEESRAIQVLHDGLDSDEPVVRRQAARSTALAGAPAGVLTDKLASLLTDSDDIVRATALQAIATIGPGAAGACDAVMKLLDDPATACDAADALGRMGPAARPAVKRLVEKLASPAVPMQWAAVRALSQIGGNDAEPAVDYLLNVLMNPSDKDGYNSVVYLALLGPVAKKAMPTLETLRIRNSALPGLARWAIEPDKRLPWSASTAGGGRGFGRGGGNPGMREQNWQRYLFDCLLDEIGDRAKPSAALLAARLLDGTAGNVPSWGYRLLTTFPDEALHAFLPALDADDAALRSRAIQEISLMGRAARPAKDRIRALREHANESEKTMLDWCLRQIDS
jgi:hypothetical protein